MSKVQNIKIKTDLETQMQAQSGQWSWENQFGADIVTIPASHVLDFFGYAKSSGMFDQLMDVTAVDYSDREKRFDVVYELFNTTQFTRLRVKVQLAMGEEVPTLTKIWRGADWFERETYDMFGMKLTGHLNMRRIWTQHQFEGHALLKD